MTELKKQEKRKALAKWLKEGLLRLGPTFIKIGQQFSTRVDILAKEYVDELAELQVCMITWDYRTLGESYSLLTIYYRDYRIKFLPSIRILRYKSWKRS